jgi:hypothetical protein
MKHSRMQTTQSYLTFYPYKKLQKISSKLGVQGIKRSGILRRFQKCAEVLSLAKGKTFFTEKLNL